MVPVSFGPVGARRLYQMTTALLIGSAVGGLIGLFHAFYVYRQHVGDSPNAVIENPVATRAHAGYYALWTLLLWVLFGSYVFYLWIASSIAFLIYKAVPKSSAD
jgi:hypothetical protein